MDIYFCSLYLSVMPEVKSLQNYFNQKGDQIFLWIGRFTSLALVLAILAAAYYLLSRLPGFQFDPILTLVVVGLGFLLLRRLSAIHHKLDQLSLLSVSSETTDTKQDVASSKSAAVEVIESDQSKIFKPKSSKSNR